MNYFNGLNTTNSMCICKAKLDISAVTLEGTHLEA